MSQALDGLPDVGLPAPGPVLRAARGDGRRERRSRRHAPRPATRGRGRSSRRCSSNPPPRRRRRPRRPRRRRPRRPPPRRRPPPPGTPASERGARTAASRSRSTTARSTGSATVTRRFPNARPWRGRRPTPPRSTAGSRPRGPSATTSPATSSTSTTKRVRSAEKAAEVDSKMYSGEISSPQELQSMQADIDQLRRHQRGAREPRARADGAARAPRRDVAGARRTARRPRGRARPRAAGARRCRGRDHRRDAARTSGAATRSPPASTRGCSPTTSGCAPTRSGAGVARLVGTTCQGCHLTIPATEVAQIKKSPGGRSRTATTAAPSSSRDARRSDHLRRRWLARQSGAGGDRRGGARPVDQPAARVSPRSASASGRPPTTSPSTRRSSPGCEAAQRFSPARVPGSAPTPSS